MFIELPIFIVLLLTMLSQIVLSVVLCIDSNKWERAYRDMHRLLKMERKARDIRN
jgi:hypothetical protein